MGTVVARQRLPGASVDEVQRLWFDLERWPSIIDGFGTLSRSEGAWPHAGARIVWDSLRNGRGRVVERVREYDPLVTQLVEVEDPQLTGTQRVSFHDAGDGCEVRLELTYELKRDPGLGATLTDVFFVRRARSARRSAASGARGAPTCPRRGPRTPARAAADTSCSG